MKSEVERGNTDTKVRARNWSITINNPTDKDISDLEYLEEQYAESRIIYQFETGKEGTKHIQGCILLKNAIAFSTLKKALPRAHLEVAIKKEALIKYCKKDETRTGPQYETPEKPFTHVNVEDKMANFTPYPWQQNIIDMMEKPADNRTIVWIWEKIGNIGKTVLAKHLCIKYENQILIAEGKASDIKYQIYRHLYNPDTNKKIPGKQLRAVIYNIPRCLEGKISYASMEQIKDGLFSNTKYQVATVVMNPIHIIIFANFEPEKKLLSADRWKIIDLNEDKIDSDLETEGYSSSIE